jgi:hypothetical protein
MTDLLFRSVVVGPGWELLLLLGPLVYRGVVLVKIRLRLTLT